MVQLNYDILFILGMEIIPVEDRQNVLRPSDLKWKPTSATQQLMKREGMLFKVLGDQALILAEPSRYEEEEGEQVPYYDITESLQLTFELRLGRKELSRYVDVGPGPRETQGNPTIPEELQAFFVRVFSNSMPVYALRNDRLMAGESQEPVGIMDAVAPPTGHLQFIKSSFSNIQLKGPLPGEDPVSPLSLLVFEEEEEKRIENPISFNFKACELPEGLYDLEGVYLTGGTEETPFAGKIFLNKGRNEKPAWMYLLIEISNGTFKSGELSYSVKLKEKLPLTLPQPEA